MRRRKSRRSSASYEREVPGVSLHAIQVSWNPLRRAQSSYGLLAHAVSALREAAIEAVWFCQPLLPRVAVTELLLSNVADKLGYVEESLGLAQALCASREELLQVADAFEPDPRFADQYNGRIAEVRGNESILQDCARPFFEREAAVGALILDHLMRLNIDAADGTQARFPSWQLE